MFKLFLITLILNTFIFVTIAFNTTSIEEQIRNETVLKASDFIFETPDVIKEYVREDGMKVRLDAFKTKNNAALLEQGQLSGLRWFSLGQPEIVKMNAQNMFEFIELSFYLQFEMLTNRDKKLLADEVKRAKGFSVDKMQFSDIDSNTIECYVELYDIQEQKISILKGKVFNLNKSPYKVEFKYPVGTKERELFEKKIKPVNGRPVNLEFKCTATAGAQIKKSNTFTITLQESNDIKLIEKLFGPANESFVTRDQLTELSNEVNSYFNVVEDYQIPQDQFSSVFVENLISLTGQTTFKPVSFDDALKSLSKYSIDFSGDLNPNQITKELSEIFKVEKLGNKSHIIFDEKYYKELEKQSSSSGSGKVSASVFGVGGGKASAQYANSQSSHWLDKGSSLDDQLNELNTYSENKIKYEFEGNKIVPKSLQVSKLQSSSFKKTLSFSRIKNYYYEADFNRVFTLNTLQHTVQAERRKYPNYSIVMLGSESMLKFFDSNGKGFDEMIGWYLCDGRNGSPDLRGRFVAGRHPNLSDYRIGNQGGNNSIQLSQLQMPSHTHLDSGHSHYIQLSTSNNGNHFHEYKDIYYSEWTSSDISNDYTAVPRNVGNNHQPDYDNVGHQISRNTFNGGDHNHNIAGNSQINKAILSNVGGNQPFDNRPLYAIVQFIIYIK